MSVEFSEAWLRSATDRKKQCRIRPSHNSPPTESSRGSPLHVRASFGPWPIMSAVRDVQTEA